MDREQQKQIVEALVLAAPEPLSAARIADVVPGLTPAGVKQLVAELGNDYAREHRGFEIWEVGGGYQLRTRPDLAAWVRQLHKERALRLSRAALETLAVIAYKQPVTRAEVEHVRGVEVGPVLRSLVERRLVRVAGHRDVPGRPLLYGTSKRFLEVFGLSSLEDLPTLREIQELVPEEAAQAMAGGSRHAVDAAEGGEEGDPSHAAEEASAEPAGELH